MENLVCCSSGKRRKNSSQFFKKDVQVSNVSIMKQNIKLETFSTVPCHAEQTWVLLPVFCCILISSKSYVSKNVNQHR